MDNQIPNPSSDKPTETARTSTPADFFDLGADLAHESVRVGHYQLKRRIGSGGMGAVYEAVQDQPRRIVALKLMRNPSGSRANLRRFEYESQLLARLHHPGIAQVYEAGTHDARGTAIPYYAMEFISGAKNITQYATEKRLDDRQILELYAQVCDAVAHANDRGVLHRDLKPQNILVNVSGEVKVIDFGIARALDSDQFSLTLQTDPNQLLGTLQYMSPEQIEGDPTAMDARSDVYSLGVVLYELLCKRLPYDVTRAPFRRFAPDP